MSDLDKQAIQADLKAGYSPDQVKSRAKARKQPKPDQPKRAGLGCGELSVAALAGLGLLIIGVCVLHFAGVL